MAFGSPSKITTMDEARKHRTYALVMLMLVYAFNFIDRRIMGVLATPIKAEFNFSDAEIGMLTGFFFAIVYTVIGAPIARIADATNRKSVLTISLTVWSAFTALSGIVTSKFQMIGARMAVGVGEAGGSPPAHAIVSDLFEPERRARALAIYSAGIYIGTLLANVGGGWISDAKNLAPIAGALAPLGIKMEATELWRLAFFMVGMPGVLFAILIQFTLREPLKGLSGAKPVDKKFTFWMSFKHLWSLKSFRYFSIATGAGTFVTYGLNDWMVSFMERTHHMDRSTIGFQFGMVAGIFGAIGTISGGLLADHLGKNDRRWFLWVPMWGKILGGPIFLLGLFMPTPMLSLACYGAGLILAAAYLGPSLAVTHSLVPPGMRAMSSAVLFVFLNILGIGLGPMLVGFWSDFMNDMSACPVNDAAVQALQACPRVTDMTSAFIKEGIIPAKTILTTDALNGAVAAGFDFRPMLGPNANVLSNTTGLIGAGIAVLGLLSGIALTAMKQISVRWGVFMVIAGIVVFAICGFFAGAFDFTFKQWAYSVRSMIPGMSGLGVNSESLRWAMILCIIVTYPMAILWHLGAQALPKGKLDGDGNAVADAGIEGDQVAGKT
jgi:MFS family permease